MSTELKPALGDRVQDQITKLTGVVVSTTDWLYGCRRIGVQPEDLKEGKPVEAMHFDEAQLVVVERGVIKPALQEPAPVLTNGGPPRGEEIR